MAGAPASVCPLWMIGRASPTWTRLGQAVAGAVQTLTARVAEHRVALTLQQSLLPDRLPRVAGFDLATRYVPASEVAEIGGDFYELSRLDGQLVVAVGDVGGRRRRPPSVCSTCRPGPVSCSTPTVWSNGAAIASTTG